MSVGKFMKQAAERDYSQWWQKPGTFPWMFQQAKPPLNPPDSARPIPTRENYERAVRGQQPYWIPQYFTDSNIIWPDAMEEHPVPEVDGWDWWGVNWIMAEVAGGMITKPGTRTFSEFANWKEELEWPDMSLVDFEADGKKIQTNLDPDRVHIYECVEGIFERLHEMIPFDESLIAFYEEPELLEEFFQKMADYKIETCDKIFKYYGRVDGVLYHDDWGTQRAGFFSNEMFREQLMPATKRLTDFIKGQGKFLELHSCGRNQQYIPMMIEMGIDMWGPQANANDIDWMFDNYNKQMSFAFPLVIKPGSSEKEIRRTVDEWVDHYGANGRILASIQADFRDPQQGAIAADELYNYSLAYYNKLYGRG